MAEHPSVLLQSGDVRDFEQAMNIVIAQYRYELATTRQLIREQPDPRPGEDWKLLQEQAKGVEEIEKLVEQARTIYHKHMDRAKAAIASELYGTKSPFLSDVADAVATGDYSGLAI